MCGAEGTLLPPHCPGTAWPFPPLALGIPASNEAAKGSPWAGRGCRGTQRWHGDGMGTCGSTLPTEPLPARLPSVPVCHQCWVLGTRLSPVSSEEALPYVSMAAGCCALHPGCRSIGKNLICHLTSPSCSSPRLGPPDHPESLGCERFCSKLSSLRSDLKA